LTFCEITISLSCRELDERIDIAKPESGNVRKWYQSSLPTQGKEANNQMSHNVELFLYSALAAHGETMRDFSQKTISERAWPLF